jgi:hypothetical protein
MNVNGKEVNVDAAFPLLVGDWKKLEQQGLGARDLENKPSITTLSKFALYICGKAAPGVVAEADIDALTMEALTAILRVANASENEKVNRPT